MKSSSQSSWETSSHDLPRVLRQLLPHGSGSIHEAIPIAQVPGSSRTVSFYVPLPQQRSVIPLQAVVVETFPHGITSLSLAISKSQKQYFVCIAHSFPGQPRPKQPLDDLFKGKLGARIEAAKIPFFVALFLCIKRKIYLYFWK